MSPASSPPLVDSAQSPFWTSIDAVIVVNLDHRTDRWARIRDHLANFAPSEKIHRLSAVRGTDLPGYGNTRWFRRNRRATTWAGRAGCILSHRNALRLARENGWRRVLILEDDAQLSPEINGTTGDQLAEFLVSRTDHPGVCYLGYTSPRGPSRLLGNLDRTHGLHAVRGCSATHAYVVDASVYQPLLDLLPETNEAVWAWMARHTAIDRWYSLVVSRLTLVAAVSPQLAIQESSHSDITDREAVYAEAGAGDELPPLHPRFLTHSLANRFAAIRDRLGVVPRALKYLIRLARGF